MLTRQQRQPLDQGPELVLAEQPDDRVAVVVAQASGIEIDGHRQVADDAHELTTLQDALARLGKPAAELLGLDLVDVLEHAFERAPGGDERRGRLLADPRHAGDVVRGVALERLVIDHLARLEPVALLDPGRVVDDRVLDARSGGHEPRPIADQLEHVQVAGHDGRVESAPLGLNRERPDHVVGLVAGQLVDRDAQRLHDFSHLWELVSQVVGHSLTGGLVLGELLVPEGGPGQVERHGDVVRPDVLEATKDDAAEAEDGVDELAAGRRQRRKGKVSAVDEPVAVEQHQAFHRQASGRADRSMDSPWIEGLSVPAEGLSAGSPEAESQGRSGLRLVSLVAAHWAPRMPRPMRSTTRDASSSGGGPDVPDDDSRSLDGLSAALAGGGDDAT